MKKEILFRGKDENGKWVYGNLYNTSYNESYIMPSSTLYITKSDGDEMRSLYAAYRIENTDTIGQYIGVKDSCEDSIFEDDILLIDGGVGVIIWDTHSMRWGLESPGSCAVDFPMREDYKRSKVIGNIHDNENIIK